MEIISWGSSVVIRMNSDFNITELCCQAIVTDVTVTTKMPIIYPQDAVTVRSLCYIVTGLFNSTNAVSVKCM